MSEHAAPSDTTRRTFTRPISVLFVDNEPGYANLAAEMLEREYDHLSVRPVESAEAARSVIEAEDGFECIVSDYDMPGSSGLDLLETVREDDPELPFILHTGVGSEEVASEAIAAGVTGYVQKEPGREGFALLANQIENAVSQYRVESQLRERERRYELTLTSLHEATRDLMRAGTKAEMYRTAVETGRELIDVPSLLVYAFDPAGGTLNLEAASEETREVLEPPSVLERGEGLAWSVFSDGEAAYHPDVREVEVADPGERVLRSQLLVPLGTHGVLVAGTESVDGFDETTTELTHILAANTEAALDRAEREQLLREHDRTLTKQNEELTRLNHTNEIVRGINHAIAQASTRREIEQTACDRLAETDRYVFAWLADTDGPDAEVTVWSGVDATYVDRVRTDGEGAPEIRLVRDALEHGEVAIVKNVLDDDAWADRRTEALTYGFQTTLAVPIADGERGYGALVIHAPQADAVSDREREVLEELGETIGHAIRSTERTRAMLTDSRVEVELSCTDERFLLNRLAARAGGVVALEGLIDRQDEAVVRFLTVSRESVESLETLPEEWATIDTLSAVSTGEDVALIEVTGPDTPFLETLREYNVTVRSARADAEGCELVLETPRGVETRTIVEAVQSAFPETTLMARRERTNSTTSGRLDAHLEERLTARQFEALQAAHYSGFYEWPRESTGEDLATALDVSPPTFHYHLRAAHRKLVGLALDR